MEYSSRLEKKLVELMQSANSRWGMFTGDEKLLVCLSGGKDSSALYHLLQIIHPKTLAAHVYFDQSKAEEVRYIFGNDVELIQADPAVKKGKNPCFSCSRNRRKLLLEYAQSQSVNKLVMGHHKSDAVETIVMNMIYSREISTMTPVQSLFEGEYSIIRPMYLIEEKLIEKYCLEKNIPTIDSGCEFDKKTKREFTKNLIKSLQKEHPKIDIEDNIFASMHNIKHDFLP